MEIHHKQDCNKLELITDYNTGEVACNSCGSVIDQRPIAVGPEVYGGTPEDFQKNSRGGQKISLKFADMGLSTVIESNDRDSSGKILSSSNRRVFYRLRMWDRNSKSKQIDKSFNKAFTLLDAIRTKLGLPESVVEKSAYLFRKVVGKNLQSGRSINIVMCGIIYLSCRLTNTPRSIMDVAKAGNVKKKYLQKVYRLLVNELDVFPESYTPLDFVTRITNSINVGQKTTRDAMRILSKVQDMGLNTSKNPIAVAAAAVNLACLKNHEKISQLKISDVSGISAVTIRDRTKSIQSGLGAEI